MTKNFFRILLGLLALILMVSCSSSGEDASTTTAPIVVTTQVRDGAEVTLTWMDDGKPYLQLPNISGMKRDEAIVKISSYQSGLADFLEMTRRNPDPIISTRGAEWVSQLSSAIDELLEAIRINDKEGLSIAVGRYEYLRSPQKTSALTKCLTAGANC